MGPISIAAGNIHLLGDLNVPDGAPGVVIFVQHGPHGRSSGRQFILERFRHAGLGTLHLDLLGPAEQAAGRMSRPQGAEIDVFSTRLLAVTKWLAQTTGCWIGYFAAGRAVPAVLHAAARHPDHVSAVVCAGGRPDLVLDALPHIGLPALLIADGRDPRSAELIHRAFAHLLCERHLEVVGKRARERVAELATSWFLVNVPAFA